MGRKERLNEVYEYVRKNFPIHTQVDFAEKLKYHRTYISSAMHGNEKNLTDKLFKNICETFPNVFNLNYLLTGEGELLLEKEPEAAPIDKQQDALTYAAIQVGKMMAELSNSIASIREFQKNLEEKSASLDHMTKILSERIAQFDKFSKAPYRFPGIDSYHCDSDIAAEPDKKKKHAK